MERKAGMVKGFHLFQQKLPGSGAVAGWVLTTKFYLLGLDISD